jgi:serine/threonine protein kinase
MIGQLLTGRYLVLKKLGVGGFSETYLARDKYLPYHPLCVVKSLKRSPTSTISAEISQRLFETEAQILEQLGQHHDQIPTLFAYCHDQDQTYQVQEYIEGENLGNWISRKRRLSADAAIALLLGALPVLNYIHTHQVIHRDVKPSNLIRRQGDGKVVLIDFGAACRLDNADANIKPDSESALAIGTPGYMPEEQQEGASQFNSDLYALGMSVIHLLTGTSPQKLHRDPISGELDWQSSLSESIEPKLIAILDRMVRGNPRDRYQRAADVLTSLASLSDGVDPAKQWHVSTPQRSIQQFLKPAAAILLVGGLMGGWYFSNFRNPIGGLLTQVSSIVHPSNVHLTLLSNLHVTSAIDQMLIAPNNRVLVTAGSDHVLRLWSLPAGSILKSLLGNTDTITALDMSQDSRLLVSGGEDRTVRLWDVASGKLLREFKGNQAAVTAIAISADAKTVVSGSKDGTLRLWDLQSGALIRTLIIPHAEVTAVTYGKTPNRLISASGDREVDQNTASRGNNQENSNQNNSNQENNGLRQLQVWDLRTGQARRTFTGHTAPIIGLQAVDDETVMSFGKDRALVWNLQREELMQVFSGDKATPIAARLDSQHMVSVDDSGSIRVWARKTGWQATTIPNRWRNLDAALSADRRYLACWSPDRRLRVWQVTGIQ